MIEIAPRLFIGDDGDAKKILFSPSGQRVEARGWSIVHAAKEPWHRQLLGYKTKGAPKDHPEYLWARRGNEFVLNLVDGDDVEYISPKLMLAAQRFINQSLASGDNVLVHCNKGQSRAPSIGAIYLLEHESLKPTDDWIDYFRADFYPPYEPAKGMRDYVDAVVWAMQIQGTMEKSDGSL